MEGKKRKQLARYLNKQNEKTRMIDRDRQANMLWKDSENMMQKQDKKQMRLWDKKWQWQDRKKDNA